MPVNTSTTRTNPGWLTLRSRSAWRSQDASSRPIRSSRTIFTATRRRPRLDSTRSAVQTSPSPPAPRHSISRYLFGEAGGPT
jgi:hypothetical protein